MTRQRIQVLTAAAATNFALGTLFAWSILLRPLNVEFDVGAAALTTVFSASLVVFAAVVLLGGRLTDTRSPRALTLSAAALAGAGLALTAVAPPAWLPASHMVACSAWRVVLAMSPL